MENKGEAEPLRLTGDFPPISTAEWEDAIRKSLQGADYDQKLIYTTADGIRIKPLYRSEDLSGVEAFPCAPGQTWVEAETWQPSPGTVRADYFHDSGATIVQQLAFALAEAVERLAAETENGRPPDEAAQTISFAFAVGSNYFLELAKVRTARLLWASVVREFGCSEAVSTRIEVRTAIPNKNMRDGPANLLRVTTEALSAVLGGCDSLTVELPGLDTHLALNVQRILKEECHLDQVFDPASGSYFIESLTQSLAEAAWSLFQQVEGLGGWTKAKEAGFVEAELNRSRQGERTHS